MSLVSLVCRATATALASSSPRSTTTIANSFSRRRSLVTTASFVMADRSEQPSSKPRRARAGAAAGGSSAPRSSAASSSRPVKFSLTAGRGAAPRGGGSRKASPARSTASSSSSSSTSSASTSTSSSGRGRQAAIPATVGSAISSRAWFFVPHGLEQQGRSVCLSYLLHTLASRQSHFIHWFARLPIPTSISGSGSGSPTPSNESTKQVEDVASSADPMSVVKEQQQQHSSMDQEVEDLERAKVASESSTPSNEEKPSNHAARRAMLNVFTQRKCRMREHELKLVLVLALQWQMYVVPSTIHTTTSTSTSSKPSPTPSSDSPLSTVSSDESPSDASDAELKAALEQAQHRYLLDDQVLLGVVVQELLDLGCAKFVLRMIERYHLEDLIDLPELLRSLFEHENVNIRVATANYLERMAKNNRARFNPMRQMYAAHLVAIMDRLLDDGDFRAFLPFVRSNCSFASAADQRRLLNRLSELQAWEIGNHFAKCCVREGQLLFLAYCATQRKISRTIDRSQLPPQPPAPLQADAAASTLKSVSWNLEPPMIAGTMSLLPFARLVASDWKFDGYQPRRLTLEDFGSSLSCVSFIDSQASANLAFKELSRAVEQSSQADELVFVGLDVETKPCFVKGTSEPAALLQLAIGSKVYLIDLLALDHGRFNKQLVHFIWTCPSLIKLGVGLDGDVGKLRSSYASEHMEFLREPAAGMLDLNQLFFHLFPHQSLIGGVSLTRLATYCLGCSVSKKQQMSNWAARPLSIPQVDYAAIDALISISIYRHLARSIHTLDGQFNPRDYITTM